MGRASSLAVGAAGLPLVLSSCRWPSAPRLAGASDCAWPNARGFVGGDDGDRLKDSRCLLPSGTGAVPFAGVRLELPQGDGGHDEITGLAFVESLIEVRIAPLMA